MYMQDIVNMENHNTQDRVEQILSILDHYDGTYERAAMDDAVALKDAITPRLIGHLETLLADPVAYDAEAHYAHVYAFVLLGHFREPRAHRVIMDIASLPERILDALFGDMVTEDFPWIFYATCGGSVGLIRELILNRGAYEYSRVSAMTALVYAVADNMLSREETLEFFGSLFKGDEARVGSDFWNGLASAMADIYPEEMMTVITKAYEDHLISPGYISQENFAITMNLGRQYAFDRVREEMRRNMPEDVHEHLSWWACFNEEETGGPVPTVTGGLKRKAREKKKKRKMAKTSRKKNRR
jgi:hypothetical protein